MGICICIGVVCIYALMCVGQSVYLYVYLYNVYLYVDEGIFPMSVCEQNTFTAQCMHFFNSHIIQQSYIISTSDNLPLKTTLHLM